MTYEEILYDFDEGIATVTLNRPAQLNALTQRMQDELREAMFRADADDAVRVVILTGAGRGFCAGADMNLLSNLSEGGEARRKEGRTSGSNGARREDFPGDFQMKNSYIPSVGKPVIAAINGACAGLGFVYTLYCDLRFAAEGAKFTSAFSRRGLIAEHGVSWMLPRIVGLPNALDILFSARKFDAAEAEAMGLVNRTFPAEEFMDEVRAYALDLARNVSPRSLRIMKRQMYEAQFQSLAEAIEVGDREMALSFDSEDFKEGVAHFVEKREARFTGR
jgi:enoyl-CoA hydratase/carnithine racemase